MSTVGYLRCSSDAQDTLRQREDIERSKIRIDHWLEDHESRDKSHKRPDFQRLLQAVQAGQVDTIVVQALDRFGVRDAWELGKFFTILKDHHCRLLDASGKQLNADDDGTVITSTVGALASSREQKEKAGRVLSGKVTLARQGNFPGGYCPYGCDVVALDAQGNEVWRCVVEGHDKRVKVYPDGRQERYDGPKNRPPKALHETLKYRPSIIEERIKYVVLIFEWYTTEAISPGQIAERLNDLGVSPVYGPLWHRGVVEYLLRNPCYTGRAVYNKASTSRFMEFVDGQVKTANRSKTNRKRTEPDQIRSEDQFTPIIEQEVFDKAQAKLAVAKKRTYRAPNTVSMWLKGFVVCGKCGKPMRISSGHYLCSSYCRFGTRSGCGHFRVDHNEIESLVLDYLVDVAPKLKALMDGSTADHLEAARPILDAIAETNGELGWVWHDMAVFAEKHIPSKAHRKATKQMNVEALYEAVYTQAKPKIEQAIADKETEIESILDGFAGLTPTMRGRVNKRLEALQKELDALKRDLADLRIPWENLRADLTARKEALERATTTLNQEGHFRQKAEALKTVIGRIVCHFGHKGKRCPLKSIDIFASEVAAVRPLGFLGQSPHWDSCQDTMKALVKAERGEGLRLLDVPVPQVGVNDVLIKILKTSICGTDVHIWNWDAWAQKTIPVPMTVGHEFVGRVAQIGSNVHDFQPGDLVSGEGHLVCGRCRNCLAGRRHLCPKTSGVGVNRPGAFAEYLCIPVTNVWACDPHIPLDVLSCFDPLGNATHTACSFDLLGEDVLITGAGPIGIMATAIARHSAARYVVVIDVIPYRLELAKKMGATLTLDARTATVADAQKQLGMKEGFDVGLEMSGNPAAFRDMLANMCHGGKIAMLGILPRTEIDWDFVVFNGLTIKGIYGREMYETWYKMTVMIQSGLDIRPAITHRFHYTEFEKAFDVMRSGQSGKVVLNWAE